MRKTEVIVGVLSALFILNRVQLSSTLALDRDVASVSKSNQEHDKLEHQVSLEKSERESFGDGTKLESSERNFTPEGLSQAIEKLKCTFVDCSKDKNTTTTLSSNDINLNPTTERSLLGDFASIFPSSIANLFGTTTSTTPSPTTETIPISTNTSDSIPK